MDFERVVSMLKKMNQVKWDYQYDTVVIGFGGAGATAARFARMQRRMVMKEAIPVILPNS